MGPDPAGLPWPWNPWLCHHLELDWSLCRWARSSLGVRRHHRCCGEECSALTLPGHLSWGEAALPWVPSQGWAQSFLSWGQDSCCGAGDALLTSGSLFRCDFSRAFGYPCAQHSAQLNQALLDWLWLRLLLRCCVTLAKPPASSEPLEVLIHRHLTDNSD